jgi:hypothetical protein
LTFSINKGPDPIIPKEGRAIATVQIDCTQQGSHLFGIPIDYPEYAYYGDTPAGNQVAGFVVIEFDLEHLFQGSGLSEVRTLMGWCRPNFTNYQAGSGDPFHREDLPFGQTEVNVYYAAMLTNLTTLQTVILGRTGTEVGNGSGSAAGGHSFGSHFVLPFPGNKHSLKYRFICPQGDPNQLKGKFTLQFCNFEINSAIISPEALIASIYQFD